MVRATLMLPGDPQPALVPLLWSDTERRHYATLAGVSVRVGITCANQTFTDDLLFTHRGLSGPAALQISSYWSTGDAVTVNVLPDRSLFDLIDEHGRSGMTVNALLSQVLPRRFVHAWLDERDGRTLLGMFSRRSMISLSARLNHWQIIPAGTEGFTKAEVTRGGIDTAGLSSRTMESKKVPGLYFIGEVVDVTGWLGGYNFQWAWSSGCAAGTALQ